MPLSLAVSSRLPTRTSKDTVTDSVGMGVKTTLNPFGNLNCRGFKFMKSSIARLNLPDDRYLNSKWNCNT